MKPSWLITYTQWLQTNVCFDFNQMSDFTTFAIDLKYITVKKKL